MTKLTKLYSVHLKTSEKAILQMECTFCLYFSDYHQSYFIYDARSNELTECGNAIDARSAFLNTVKRWNATVGELSSANLDSIEIDLNNLLQPYEPYQVVSRNCPCCGKHTTIMLTEDQHLRYRRWCQGEDLIQNLLPDLTIDEREMLKTGICPECWKKDL